MNLKPSFTLTLPVLSQYVCEGERARVLPARAAGWTACPRCPGSARSAPVRALGHLSSLRVLFTLFGVMPARFNAWPAAAVAGPAGSPADSMGGNDKRELYAWL